MHEKRNGDTKQKQVFDWACKMLMNMSHASIVHFINGLFQKDYPADSSIAFLSTEHIRTGVSRLFSDFLLAIGGDKYHIEFQLKKDETIALRVFEYCFEEAKRDREEDGDGITLRFAQTKVVYLQENWGIPPAYTIWFQMPSGEKFRYEVPVMQLLAKSVGEIEEEGLVLLLPLYQLKMRGIKKLSPQKRAGRMEEFKAMLGDIESAFHKALSEGAISEGDGVKLADVLGTVYRHLYSDLKDMEEVNDMVEEKFTSWFDELAEKVRQKSMVEGMQQGMQQGMQVTYLLTKNPGLSDEELNERTGCDVESIRKIRKEIMELS